MDPIQCAITGVVHFFKTVPKDVLLKARDNNGYTTLDRAIMNYHEDCCEEICRMCPELVWAQQNIYKHSALHHAASRGNVNMATSVIDAAAKVPEKDDIILNVGGKKVPRRILRLQDVGNRTPLWYAVYDNRYDATRYLLELDHEFVLGSPVESNAAIAKATETAKRGDFTAARIRDLLIQTQNSRPTVGMKEKNWTELHKAASRGDIDAVNSRPTVGVKEKNWTELHKAASRGDIDAVKQTIQSNPKQLNVVDSEKQNFVHLAAQFGHIEIVKFVLEEAEISSNVLNAQDLNGNTPLHVAVLAGKRSVALCLLYDDRVIKKTVNAKGQKALDLVTFAYDPEKAKDRV